MPGKYRSQLPSQEMLARMLDYNPKTGELIWRHRTPDMFNETEGRTRFHACAQWNSRWAGKPAMNKPWNGYYVGKLDYQNVSAHRVIWKMVHGVEPDIIDHIDGDGTNNTLVNLRNVSDSDNKRNARMRSNNTSGMMGVRYDRKSDKWVATIQVGTFDSKDEAFAARKAAELALGYHPNHGRKAA